jgi:hypothetical protein
VDEPMSAQPRRVEPSPAADDARLAAPLADLRSVLIPEETLEAWAVQRRIYALKHRRLLLAATSGRLVWIHRKLLGGFDVANVRWQDLEDVSLRVGILAAELVVRAGRAADLASEGASSARLFEFKGLRKAQAQAVYRICQAQDQAWREKRRIRELEELRARSGGLQIAGGVAPATDSDAVRRLSEAKQMLEQRLISDSEYEAIKARILSGG